MLSKPRPMRSRTSSKLDGHTYRYVHFTTNFSSSDHLVATGCYSLDSWPGIQRLRSTNRQRNRACQGSHSSSELSRTGWDCSRHREFGTVDCSLSSVRRFRQGLNTKKGFDVKVAAEISKITGLEFKTAPNKASVPFTTRAMQWTDLGYGSSRRLLVMMPSSKPTVLSTSLLAR